VLMRNKRLDVLRCIAVLLVLFFHGNILPSFARGGWAGVDLFFVLSGFLISGLLFSEYQKRGSIGFKRFFVRRGLKIYPAFYVFLLFTVVVEYGIHNLNGPVLYLREMFFVQNYLPSVWGHTWSLAVEEHFYIFLPVLLLLLVRLSSNRENPFEMIPWTFVVIAIACPIFRAVSVSIGPPNYRWAYGATHERMDALFFGVSLGYLHHFRPEILNKLLRPGWNRLTICLLSVSALSLIYTLPKYGVFFTTIGLSLVYLGFGGIMLLSLHVRGILPSGLARVIERIGDGFAFVGVYSYSIYLWHGGVGAWGPGLVRKMLNIQMGESLRFAIYFFGSLAFGILMSRLIEYPVLRLRDRIFPAMQDRTSKRPDPNPSSLHTTT
jgi:peptidoglycan/LPS O-acetylase OafA/YrhL